MWSLLLKRYQSKCTKPCGFRTNRTWPHLYSPSDAFNLTLTQHRVIHAQKQRCIHSQKTALNTQGAFYIYTQHRLKHTKQRRVIHTTTLYTHSVAFSIYISPPYTHTKTTQAEPWWRASIWRSHRKVVIKQCSYHNKIIDIQNRLPYSKVVYPAIIVLFSCLMEVNHGVRTGPDYPL